jgi:hypothetical protein
MVVYLVLLMTGCSTIVDNDGSVVEQNAYSGDDDDNDDDDNTGQTAEWDIIGLGETCKQSWTKDECEDGDCADSDLEQRFVNAFFEWLQEDSGMSDTEIEEHVRLRRVNTKTTEHPLFTKIVYEIKVDWFLYQVSLNLYLEGRDPSIEEIKTELENYQTPVIDLDAELMPLSKVQEFVTECEDAHQVTLNEGGLCFCFVPSDSDDDFQGISCRFSGRINDTNRRVEASVDLLGTEPNRCALVEEDPGDR